MEGIVGARIDRLEEDIRHVLKLASVIGRNFHRRILRALDDAENQLDDCLKELETLELIRQKQHAPEIEYMFKHSVVQEVTYGTLLGERRKKLHESVATAMEELFHDRLNEFSSFLAYHYARAENWLKAQEYMLKAGDQAARMAADTEAVDHYRNTLNIITGKADNNWAPHERAALECKLGEVLFRLGQHEEATESLFRALRLLGISIPRSRWHIRLTLIHRVLIRLLYYLRGGHKRALNEKVVPINETLGRTIASLAWIDYFSNRERFILNIIVGLDIAERSGPAPEVAEGYMGLGIACNLLGLRKLANFHHQHAKDLAVRLGDRHATANVEFGIGMHNYYVGNWDEATFHLRGAATIWQELKKTREWGLCLLTLATLLRSQGELRQTHDLLSEVERVGNDSRDIQLETAARFYIGLCELERGSIEVGDLKIIDAVQRQTEFNDISGRPEFLTGRAWSLICQGEKNDAQNYLDEAHEIARRERIPAHLEVLLRTIEARQAQEAIFQSKAPNNRASRKHLKRAISALNSLARVFAGAVPASLQFQGSLAWINGSATKATLRWNAAIEAANQLGSSYLSAQIYLTQGQATGDDAALHAASELFRKNEAWLELARCYRYLASIYAENEDSKARHYFNLALGIHENMDAEYERNLLRLALNRQN